MADPLAVLADHLANRRSALLQTWRQAALADPLLRTGKTLTREQVNDHIPALLASFERDLRNAGSTPQGAGAQAGDTTATQADAEAHGLHRWRQGYDLHEVARELGLLNECMCIELDAHALTRPPAEATAMAEARRRWARACTVAMSESTAQFFRLQQLEAAGHIEELEGALDDLLDMESLRAQLWQQAAHDLRGNVAVVSSATAVLSHAATPDAAREHFLDLLQRNVHALNHLLGDVTTLARLQAGQESRTLQALDAATLLHDMVQSLAGVAAQRGLSLQGQGPATLPVQGDAVKLRRIVQNLVLNALAYTQQGGVELRWGDAPAGDARHWALTLRDTGPGLHSRRNAALAGEGLGLSIVKRLCELLDATVDVQSEADVGTTFTILFPRAYPTEAASNVP
jgi:signal transduction histidine kinase